MTPEQVDLVQDSFSRILPVRKEAGVHFYERLFEIAPETRRLFRGDIRSQGDKLMSTLTVVVAALPNLDSLLPVARDLASRHVGYGVEPGHYVPVGQALIDTLEAALDLEFTEEVRDAWAEAYATLSTDMIATAYKPTEPVS
jgi:nitric oxide dioxygenase